MKIGVGEARKYFEHPSQHVEGTRPDILPAEGVHYYANGPICGLFHLMHDPGIYMAHYGVMPEGWGRLTFPARTVLAYAFDDLGAERFVGWTDEKNRAALAFAKRIGFKRDGVLPLRDKTIIMQGWTPWA